jgi:hypothetical protein
MDACTRRSLSLTHATATAHSPHAMRGAATSYPPPPPPARRFGDEHPGFDFRDAAINGQVPDPRTFMGGVKYG